MTFIQRLGYYLGGFSIGLIVLAFFLSGKKTSCDYGPNARVKKNIRTKELDYEPEAKLKLLSGEIDSTTISHLLHKGDVNFSESNTNLDSCKVYVIEGSYQERDIKLKIENCDSIATIQSIIIQ